ncbi:hypothetical protein N0V83_001449 [Neocucurbitaria cava]|uniref:Uncharacterized protein n=1 Tax=Neocucurbitaria cava TaxID=798079 RepID=A0A9W8YF96_9PLEO|nr:hypothetical protein N0V83_001449 [Neocucurbitaria cava]
MALVDKGAEVKVTGTIIEAIGIAVEGTDIQVEALEVLMVLAVMEVQAAQNQTRWKDNQPLVLDRDLLTIALSSKAQRSRTLLEP